MTTSKNYTEDDDRLTTIVHRLTEHAETIRAYVAADDESAAWHEMSKLTAYLVRELT